MSTSITDSGTAVHGRDTYVRWRIMALLIVASFVAYVLRSNMSIAGDALRKDMGFSLTELGLILSANAWAYAIFQFPGGILGDRYGPHRVIAAILAAWGCITLLTGMVPATGVLATGTVLWILIGLRFLLGMCQAPIYPVGCPVVSNWFPPSGWALPNALSSTGLTLGAAVTAPAMAWAVGEFGWRNSFFYTAPLAFVVAAVWWWYARDNPADHRSVTPVELELIRAGRTSLSAAPPEPGAWKKVLMNRNVLLLTGAYFSMCYTFYIFLNWFYIYLIDQRGFKALEGGFMAAAPWLAGALFAAMGGWTCDRLIARYGIRHGCRIPAVIGLSLVSVLLFAGATAGSPYVAVALLALCLGCTQFTEGAFWAAIISVSGRNSAAAGGIMNTGGNAVGGLGAVLVPFIAERVGWVPALASGSLFALIGVVLWMFVRADEVMESTP